MCWIIAQRYYYGKYQCILPLKHQAFLSINCFIEINNQNINQGNYIVQFPWYKYSTLYAMQLDKLFSYPALLEQLKLLPDS